MLALVMDGGSHLKRPWNDEPAPRSPENRRLLQTISDSAGARPNIPQLHKMPSPSHMLPPIATGPEQVPRLQAERLSATSVSPGAPHRASHLDSPEDASSKRPRLYYETPYQLDSGRNQPSNHSTPTQMPPSSHDRHNQQQWPVWESRNPEGNYSPRINCQNCMDSKGLVEKVVSGLERLEAELRQVLASSPLGRNFKEVRPARSISPDMTLICSQESNEPVAGPNVAEAGMKNSLIWASNSVEASTRLIRDFAASQRALPRITVANLGIVPAHEQPSAITSAPPDFARGFMDKHDKERLKDGHRRFGPPYRNDYQLRPPDSAQPPPSPHPSASSGSVYTSGQSPLGMGASGRMLPSPSSLHAAPSLPSVQGNYSPVSTQSAHATHLQDLQHQISTKSLALTTLQREHDQLLAAYSRMQIRGQTLDKKSQVSDHEINTLTEEKIRLQSQVEAFEVQVEELVKARDEAQKQTTTNGAQYMRIMAMSSKLQIQGAEEAKRYKTDRETWERDREGLQRRIEDLEAGRTKPSMAGDMIADDNPAPNSEDILTSASLDVLRNEVIRLRQSLLSMERMVQDVRQETQNIDHVITECASIRERLSAKTVVPGQQIKTIPTGTPEQQSELAPALLTDVAELAKSEKGESKEV
jgi:hypothetical protein